MLKYLNISEIWSYTEVGTLQAQLLLPVIDIIIVVIIIISVIVIIVVVNDNSTNGGSTRYASDHILHLIFFSFSPTKYWRHIISILTHWTDAVKSWVIFPDEICHSIGQLNLTETYHQDLPINVL